MSSKTRFGELLVQQGVIDEEQLSAALGHQRNWGKRLGEVLVELGFVTEAEICKHLSKALRIPIIDLTTIDPSQITLQVLKMIPLKLARDFRIVPLSIRKVRERERLIVATADPTNYKGFDEIQFKTGFNLLVMIAPSSDIGWFIRRYYLNEMDALSKNYISTLAHKGTYAGQKTAADPLSAMFEDSQFSKQTNEFRGKRDPKK